MSFLFLIFFSFLGLIVGSFLNVVILRHNTGASLGGRSGCFSCGHNLTWYELVPVVSFLALRGRCNHCGCKISRQYPLVEIFTSFLFILSAWKFYPDFVAIIFYAILMALLVVIVVYDLKHKIIPNKPTYIFGLLALLSPAITGFYYLSASDIFSQIFVNLIGGTVIFLFFFSLWYFSSGRWMGFGDAKLGFGIGALLGLSGAINAVVWAFWLGALSGLILIALSKIKTKKIKLFRRGFSIKSEIPFAPFLVLGLILNLFWNVTVFVF